MIKIKSFKNKNFILGITSIIVLSITFIIAKNKFYSNYDQLPTEDKEILWEYNKLYNEISKNNLWENFNLADKTIVMISDDTTNSYIINPKDFNVNLFTKKITMPNEFNLKSVYRISPVYPKLIKMRFSGNFNTIGKIYNMFNNDIYFIKYNKSDSLEKKYSNSHFAPFLSHEAFHYYMQNDWKIISPPITGLSDDDKKLLKEEYNILNNIQEELLSKTNNKDTLLKYAKHYVDIVSKRIDKNNDYLMSELSKETAEGTAQYVGIKAAQIVNYDYGVMYFDNIKNVPFSDIFVQLEKWTIHTDYLYKRIPYESGALLCFLFDELGIPNWQQKLNAQTEENPVTLYDILNEYLN